jgi:hypothetical protein
MNSPLHRLKFDNALRAEEISGVLARHGVLALAQALRGPGLAGGHD